MAEYYSRQLSQNIQRGMDYNAQHALYNGHKLFGYGVDKSTKRYIVDPDTAPFVQRMFAEYAEGKAMQTICDELNAQGLRTTRGAKFGVKTTLIGKDHLQTSCKTRTDIIGPLYFA